jgi:hypothetical protein
VQLQIQPLLPKGHTHKNEESFTRGIYVNLHARSEHSVQRTRGREKPKKPPLPFRSFHTSPPELGRWRAGCFRPSAALLACSASAAPRLRPSSQPASTKSSENPVAPRLDLPGRAVLGGGVFGVGGGLELTRGVSSDTCCGAVLEAEFLPFPSGVSGSLTHWAGFFHLQKKQQLGFLLGAHGWSARRRS